MRHFTSLGKAILPALYWRKRQNLSRQGLSPGEVAVGGPALAVLFAHDLGEDRTSLPSIRGVCSTGRLQQKCAIH